MARLHSTARRAAAVVALCTATAAGTDIAAAQATDARPRCAGADTAAGPAALRVQAMSCLIDAERRRAGERVLRPDRRLRRSAAAKAREIARCHRFAHDACGRPWSAEIIRAGYASGGYRIGENLAWTARGTPRAVLRSWLRSPVHRANVLDGRYRDTGLARCTAELPGVDAVEVWVQHFGCQHCDTPAEPRPARPGT